MTQPAGLTGYQLTVSSAILTVQTGVTGIAIFGRYDGYPYCDSIGFTSPPVPGSHNVFIAYWIPTPPPPTWGFPEAVSMWEPQWITKSPNLGRNYTQFTPRTFSPYRNPWIRVAIFNNNTVTDDFLITINIYENALQTTRRF